MIRSGLFGMITLKKEMTTVMSDGSLLPVTLLYFPDIDVVRYKTIDSDGYEAVVLGYQKKVIHHKKGTSRVVYKKLAEFAYDEDFKQNNPIGPLNRDYVFARIREKNLHIVGFVKGRGYAGVVKRFGAQGGPETHGSKFHRHIGSMGCRKPRRVIKGHIHAGHMGTNRVSVKNKRCLDVFSYNSNDYLVVHGSVPGSYNSYVYCSLMA